MMPASACCGVLPVISTVRSDAVAERRRIEESPVRADRAQRPLNLPKVGPATLFPELSAWFRLQHSRRIRRAVFQIAEVPIQRVVFSESFPHSELCCWLTDSSQFPDWPSREVVLHSLYNEELNKVLHRLFEIQTLMAHLKATGVLPNIWFIGCESREANVGRGDS